MTLLSVRDAARCYRVSRHKLYRAIGDGRMTQADDGKVQAEEIEQLIDLGVFVDKRRQSGHNVA